MKYTRVGCGRRLNRRMSTLKDYVRQPSTWLGLAKLGAAFGLYSTGIGGAIGSVIMGLFGLVDVVRNERGQKPFSPQ